MKNIPQIRPIQRRIESDPRPSRPGRAFPQADQNYHNTTLPGSCGAPLKFSRDHSFRRISNEYFAEEAPRSFAVEAGVFAALILTALLPIVNSVEAVATLIHSVGVL